MVDSLTPLITWIMLYPDRNIVRNLKRFWRTYVICQGTVRKMEAKQDIHIDII